MYLQGLIDVTVVTDLIKCTILGDIFYDHIG